MTDLSEKVILLGGGLGRTKKGKLKAGLGVHIAKRLIAGGAKQVIVTDIDEEVVSLAAAEIGGNCKGIACDLLKERKSETKEFETERGIKTEVVWTDNPAQDLVEQVVDEFGKIDVLITAFDEYDKGRVEKSDMDMYEKLKQGNVTPVFHLLGAIRPQFAAQAKSTGKMGKVIILTHMVGKAGMAMASLYSAFKGGMVGLVKSLAREFGRFASVVGLACGAVSEKNMFGPKDRMKKRYMVTQTEYSNIKLKPELIAGPVAFLASDDADGISGQTYSVDGGLWLKVEI